MDNVHYYLNHANVLMAENSSPGMKTFVNMLIQKGCSIRSAKGGEALLKLAEESLPDIILLSVDLIDGDGYHVCEIIKADGNLMEVPVVFIFDSFSTINSENIFKAGGDDYININCNYDEAFVRIETHIKLRSFQLESKRFRNSLQQWSQVNEELTKENNILKKSLKERDRQLEEITAELKEFNICLEEEINERTRTEEALRESESQFRHAIEASPVSIILYTEDGEITKISKAWTDITGYTLEDIPNIYKLDQIAEVLKEDEDDDKAFNFRDTQGDEIYTIKTKNGDTRFLDVYSSYIGKLQDGRNLYSKAAIDITEKMTLTELREYDRIKTEFFSNISHELRTPINVIFSALQILEIKLKNHISQEASTDEYKYTKIMRQNCYRLMRLINNIIDITKIDSGYYDVNKNNIDIVSLVENITLSVADYIENKGLSLIFDTDVEEKVIACDAEKIERIILNLLSNAVKFTPEGGRINVNIEDCNENICIKVMDTGRGIPGDKLNFIFERFVQVDKSLTRDHEGSGIGLSLVKCLVELHDGTISVKSREGLGTEFIINFPCKLVDAKDENSNFDQISENSIEKINLEFSDIYNLEC